MKELLTKITSNGLITLCVIMSLIALILAICISVEMYKNYSLKKKKSKKSEVKLNIKKDENITYVEEDEELEKTKAKLELAKLREKLKKEEEEKKALIEEEKSNSEVISSITEEVSTAPVEADKSKLVEINTESIENLYDEQSEEEKALEDGNTVKNEVVQNTPEVIENAAISDTIPEEKKEIVEVKKNVEVFSPIYIEGKEFTDKPIISYSTPIVNSSNKDGLVHVKATVQTIEVKKEIIETPIAKKIEPEEDNEDVEILDDEDTAIISYDELKKAQEQNNFGYSDEDMNKYKDEEDAIISIGELQNIYKEFNDSIDENNKKEVDLSEKIDRITSKENSSLEVDSTAIHDSPNKEITFEFKNDENSSDIQNTNQFLKYLKDFRKNLN